MKLRLRYFAKLPFRHFAICETGKMRTSHGLILLAAAFLVVSALGTLGPGLDTTFVP
jgi:Trk-type K+ transport system membrane component